MTTLDDRPSSAVLVVDVQNGVVGEAHERTSVVANIAALIEKARAAGVEVVWVQHDSENLTRGTEEWQLVPELESVLADRGIGRLYGSGAQTDECIRSTLHGAIARGYDATLVSDAHTTEDLSSYGAPPADQVIAHTNLYWKYHRTAGTVAVADVDFAASAGA